MKFLIVVALLAVGAYSKVITYEPIITGDEYHEKIGIPEFERIRLAEEQQLSDPSRIVGGGAASLGQLGYTAALMISLTSGATSICGASLVTTSRLVTAAHCWGSNARLMTVVLGTVQLSTGGTRITAINVQVHGAYNPSNYNFDVAVINVMPVTLNNNIRTISLASGTNTYVGSTATLSGFRQHSENGAISSNQAKHFVTAPIMENADCAAVYGSSAIIPSTMCTSGANGRGSCGGDSGGPVVVGNVLVGVISFGAAVGCQRGFPSGHGRITSFHAWISQRL